MIITAKQTDHYMEQAVLHVDSMPEPGHSVVCSELSTMNRTVLLLLLLLLLLHPFNGRFSRTTWATGTRKVKPVWN